MRVAKNTIIMGFLVAAIVVLSLFIIATYIGDQETTNRSRFRMPDSLPYSKKKFFFSAAERSFYEILRRLTPDHTVFAKVRMCDVIAVSERNGAWRSNHNRIQSKHLDFLICDATLAPVVAIELDDLSHARANRKARDQFVDAALAAAEVPILHIPVKRSYVIEDIRRLIFPHISAVGPLC
jgi:hypothetical protein